MNFNKVKLIRIAFFIGMIAIAVLPSVVLAPTCHCHTESQAVPM